MKGPHKRDHRSGKKKPRSSSGAKLPLARSGQQGKGSSRRPAQQANKAASQRSRPQARAAQRPRKTSAPAALMDIGLPKRKILISNWWGAFIGLAAIVYFIYQTITAGFNYISLFLTFAGLTLGAWLAVAWIAVQFVRLNWFIIIYLPAAATITLGFAAMSQPEPLLFFNAPRSAAPGACTGSPTGWIFHGFQPGQCIGVATGRIGLVVAGGLVTLIMIAINRSIKWRVRYRLDTVGRRRFIRNEGKAWVSAHRTRVKPQLDEIHRKRTALRKKLKAYPRGSEEAARIRDEVRQLDSEHGNTFRSMLRDIHLYRKDRREERRQGRRQWQLKDWLHQHPGYAADRNSVISDSGDPAKGIGAPGKARKPADKYSPRSPSSKVLDGPKIIKGPVKHRSKFKPYYSFSYCVEHWTKHYDIYVYIDPAAPKHIVKTAGRAALETVLRQGKTPNRFFIDSSGKIITTLFTPD